MSSYIRQDYEGDPFDEHPAAGGFLKAAEFALEHYGDARIPRDTLIDLQYAFGVPDHEVPALAYLAQHRVNDKQEIAL